MFLPCGFLQTCNFCNEWWNAFVFFFSLLDLMFSSSNHSPTRSSRNFLIFIFLFVAFWYTTCAFTMEVFISKYIASFLYDLILFRIVVAYDIIWLLLSMPDFPLLYAITAEGFTFEGRPRWMEELEFDIIIGAC